MNKLYPQLKIGLDYHGVINNHPLYFKHFCDLAHGRGHHMYILSGGSKPQTISQLTKAQIRYTGLFTIMDYYLDQGKGNFMDDGHFKIDDRLWNTAKAQYCRCRQIDIQIDDSLIYGKYFTTPYCVFDAHTKQCVLTKCENSIDFSLPPQEALLQLEKILVSHLYHQNNFYH